MAEQEEGRRPILFVVTLIAIGLYLAIRLFEGAVCLGDWLLDWGTCSW